jgi:hypothetical protein
MVTLIIALLALAIVLTVAKLISRHEDWKNQK